MLMVVAFFIRLLLYCHSVLFRCFRCYGRGPPFGFVSEWYRTSSLFGKEVKEQRGENDCGFILDGKWHISFSHSQSKKKRLCNRLTLILIRIQSGKSRVCAVLPTDKTFRPGRLCLASSKRLGLFFLTTSIENWLGITSIFEATELSFKFVSVRDCVRERERETRN